MPLLFLSPESGKTFLDLCASTRWQLGGPPSAQDYAKQRRQSQRDKQEESFNYDATALVALAYAMLGKLRG